MSYPLYPGGASWTSLSPVVGPRRRLLPSLWVSGLSRHKLWSWLILSLLVTVYLPQLNLTSWATILSICGLVQLKEPAYRWVASYFKKGMPRPLKLVSRLDIFKWWSSNGASLPKKVGTRMCDIFPGYYRYSTEPLDCTQKVGKLW